MRRVALFGGSFDPVHNAHLALARAALGALALDEVRWVPVGRPWQKARAITPAVHREAMLRLALAGQARQVIERIEIEREGPSYTLQTVHALRAREPDTAWVLLIGQDQYAGLHTWSGWRELLALVALAVARRPGAPAHVNPDVERAGHHAVPLPMTRISATAIRGRVAAGLDISDLVPPEVAGYIARHGLYRSPGRS